MRILHLVSDIVRVAFALGPPPLNLPLEQSRLGMKPEKRHPRYMTL